MGHLALYLQDVRVAYDAAGFPISHHLNSYFAVGALAVARRVSPAVYRLLLLQSGLLEGVRLWVGPCFLLALARWVRFGLLGVRVR